MYLSVREEHILCHSASLFFFFFSLPDGQSNNHKHLHVLYNRHKNIIHIAQRKAQRSYTL